MFLSSSVPTSHFNELDFAPPVDRRERVPAVELAYTAALREVTTWCEAGAGEEVTRAEVGRACICVPSPRRGTEAAHRRLSSLVETGFIYDCL